MTTTYEKSIEYDPESKDFRMMLDGELVGFGRTYHEAETTLDRLVFELISDTYFSSPTPKPPSCPSCGDAVREPGTCAACQETDGQITTFTRCLTCQKLTEDVVCPDCQITTHRCEAGHALGDDGRCEGCSEEQEAAENERIRQEAYAIPETDESRHLLEIGRQIIQQIIAERYGC